MFAISTLHYIAQYQCLRLNELEDKVTVHPCWLQLTILVTCSLAISTLHYIRQYQSLKLNELEDKVTMHPCWLQLTILVMYRLRYDTDAILNVLSKGDINQLNLPHGTNK